MPKGFTQEQQQEYERLRMHEHIVRTQDELERKRQEQSRHTSGRIAMVVGVIGAAAGVVAVIQQFSPATIAPAPAVIIQNTNGDNSGDIAYEANHSTGHSRAGRDGTSVNQRSSSGQGAGAKQSAAAVESVQIPRADTAPKTKPARIAPPLSDYEKYIDSSVQRLAGTTNVAIVLRGLPGHPPGALERAVQSTLRERGFRVVPIFRNRFREDEAELRLFDGDAAFVKRLQLRDHCDSVLVGVLRFTGPAQAVDGGLYVREAVLEIRAVDPATGLVIDSLEISEKGGGTTAELSSINAVSRLRENVIANISGWSWV